MASESTDDESVRITLPAELGAWLDDRAADLDVDRETLLRQLLAAYRTTAELDSLAETDDLPVVLGDEAVLEDHVGSAVAGEVESALEDDIEPTIEAAVDSSIGDEVEELVAAEVQTALAAEVGELIESRVADAVEAALAERFETTPTAVSDDLGSRIDALETEFDGKIQDVRERVIQVKKEADAKAPAEHGHDELDRIDGLVTRLAEVESAVGRIEDDLGDEAADREAAVADVSERLDEVQDRLQTVAWVVSDLREAQESRGGLEAVDRIKRAAAELDIDRARCENCGNGVALGLLTEPNCPHCEATVTNVEDASGFFGKPVLLVASQLESGE